VGAAGCETREAESKKRPGGGRQSREKPWSSAFSPPRSGFVQVEIDRSSRHDAYGRRGLAGQATTARTSFPMDFRVLFCICVHYPMSPPVHGASGSRIPAQRLYRTNFFTGTGRARGREKEEACTRRAGARRRWLHRKPLRPFGYRLLNEAAGRHTVCFNT